MSSLNLDHTPPAPGPDIPIVRIKAGQSRRFTCLSKSLWGIWTHWAGDRSEPCFAEKKECPGCKRGLPRRWKGYFHAFEHNAKRYCFVELTPTTASNLNGQIPHGETLRGLHLELRRSAAQNGRLNITIVGTQPDNIPLAEARDPFKVLCRLWGIQLPGQPPINGNGWHAGPGQEPDPADECL